MSTQQAAQIGHLSVEAIAGALDSLRQSLPGSTERDRLLMLLTGVSASCGMLGVTRGEFLNIVVGAFEGGTSAGPVENVFG